MVLYSLFLHPVSLVHLCTLSERCLPDRLLITRKSREWSELSRSHICIHTRMLSRRVVFQIDNVTVVTFPVLSTGHISSRLRSSDAGSGLVSPDLAVSVDRGRSLFEIHSPDDRVFAKPPLDLHRRQLVTVN